MVVFVGNKIIYILIPACVWGNEENHILMILSGRKSNLVTFVKLKMHLMSQRLWKIYLIIIAYY
jgi:hypothetical protein